MRLRCLLCAGILGVAGSLKAQTSPPKPLAKDSMAFEFPDEAVIPARFLLDLGDTLKLTQAQIGKLEALERSQLATRTRATALFLRAEADLLDAMATDDPLTRRAALEKRSKIAIDAEISRLQGERESRGVLTPDQRMTLVRLAPVVRITSGTTEASEWRPLVAPRPVNRLVRLSIVDSTEVRITVTPLYADIFLDGDRVGTGRKFIVIPVGSHEIKFHALGCADVVLPIQVERGPPVVIPPQTLKCSLPH